jgi:uncharacterized membrane protein
VASKAGQRIWLWVMAFGAVGVALASYRYLIPGAPGAAPPILANRFTHLGALTLHASFAGTALLIGPFQFVAGLRARHASLHRRMGTVYVLCCLLGGAAGFVLAFGTTAGPLAMAGFAALAPTWIYATARAWRYARAREFTAHRRWMIRSFALTFAAVTLRIYLPISMALAIPYAHAYPVIAWLAWVPNLIVAELYIRQSGRAPIQAALA